MKFFSINHQTINLELVTRLQFDENDKKLTGDDRCSIFFVDGSEMEIYGETAKVIYEGLLDATDASPLSIPQSDS